MSEIRPVPLRARTLRDFGHSVSDAPGRTGRLRAPVIFLGGSGNRVLEFQTFGARMNRMTGLSLTLLALTFGALGMANATHVRAGFEKGDRANRVFVSSDFYEWTCEVDNGRRRDVDCTLTTGKSLGNVTSNVSFALEQMGADTVRSVVGLFVSM